MNYQHAYHAGTIADVFKHIVLIQLLKSFHKKPNAITYFETHAGNALYDLHDEPAQKTLEFQPGIDCLWKNKAEISHPAIMDYLNVIQTMNPDNLLQFYPGSGLIARQFLRPQDEAILCELHPEVCQALRNYFTTDPQIHVHFRNGYEALSALLPPKSKRGLVLIDPPYEIKDEFSQLIAALQKMQTRWPTGTYAIWFPIKQYELILQFYAALKKLSFHNILATELWTADKKDENALKGSGLVILNPPWLIDETLKTALPELTKALHLSEKYSITWLAKN